MAAANAGIETLMIWLFLFPLGGAHRRTVITLV